MIVLVIGGAKSGKSLLGEEISRKLSKKDNLVYLATMKPFDKDDLQRIKNHREERKDKGFKTLEVLKGIKNIKGDNNTTILLDSVTSLLTNEMFHEGEIYKSCEKKICSDIQTLSSNVKNLVIVSDNISLDENEYDAISENYRRTLGKINCYLCELCHVVIEVSYCNKIIHKGEEWVENEKDVYCI